MIVDETLSLPRNLKTGVDRAPVLQSDAATDNGNLNSGHSVCVSGCTGTVQYCQHPIVRATGVQ
jgi:hypothetical protein